MAATNRPALICYDGSEAADRAIREAAALLGASNGREALVAFVWQATEESLGVLEGFRGRDAPAGPPSAAQDLVEHGAHLAGEAGFSATPMLVKPSGSVAETLVGLAEEHDAGVIVVGVHGHGPIKAAVLGSVSQEILNDFRRPKLVV